MCSVVPMPDKDLDVVVFGATGVTGRRVAEYLASRAQECGVRWAAAARDAGKLARTLAEVGVSAPETIVADVGDPASLAAMAARARVVLDLVGPYGLYGRPVIEACVEQHAHYADLTGEMPFARRTIDEFDAPAAAARVKVVQACGFESLPPDLSVMLASDTARERLDEELDDVQLEVAIEPPPGRPRLSDGISGGTAQTMLVALADDEPDVVIDPAALIGDPRVAANVRYHSPIMLAPRRGVTGGVIAPMVPLAFINPAVIQRSAWLSAPSPTRALRYREGIALNGAAASLPLRLGLAWTLSGVQASLRSALRASPDTRARLARALRPLLPSSGFGPRADRLEGWEWRISVTARTSGGHSVSVRAVGIGHPGYLATARILGETGILLAEEDVTPSRFGCLTPSLALGRASLARFERAGLRFSTDTPTAD